MTLCTAEYSVLYPALITFLKIFLHLLILEIKNLYQLLFQFCRQEEEDGFPGSAVGSIK